MECVRWILSAVPMVPGYSLESLQSGAFAVEPELPTRFSLNHKPPPSLLLGVGSVLVPMVPFDALCIHTLPLLPEPPKGFLQSSLALLGPAGPFWLHSA